MSDRRNDPDYAFLFAHGPLEQGDAVVHFEHGLASFEGEEVLEVPDGEGGTAKQKLVRLRYRDDGKLLLPEAEMKHIWRYGAPAENLTLDRLKAGDWIRRRDELIVELKDAARDLAAEYRFRRGRPAPTISPDERMKAFESDFPYEETAHQRRAIEQVMGDLATSTPMDRIVIGDVGFGKTEVALRAVAAVVFSGLQAAVAVPTTVLAQQHAQTFRERLEPHGVRVVLLDGEASADVVEAIESGEAHVVVGTHALATRDVTFRDLALVVIDEEQRFGVEVKRELRSLHADTHAKRGLHVLAMTATPIPRTLAAAEVSLIDVSVVAEAPKDRLPVDTQVHAAEPDGARELMEEALRRELERGGQAYVVCPRIEGIEGKDDADGVADFLDGLDATVAVAHGRLPTDEIEKAMLRFMRGEADVLLATSIIEAGIDNPRANTMIVWNADRFGLAQLHQLRGRIGRSNLPAYMTLLTRRDLSEDAELAKRLEAFRAMSELGAGFAVARKDQELRGFGTLGGDDQSGQVSRLGIELYRHLLAEALRGELKELAEAA